MQFGITLKPDISIERIVGLTRQAEAAGFEYGWIFDSHVLWQEPYPLLTLMATNTQRMRLGTCVTNPATRDLTVTASLFATLNLISGGRMEFGIGRGDGSRLVLGKNSWCGLHMAGILADGMILKFAGPPLIAGCMGCVKEGSRAAGRDLSRIEVMAAAPA